MPVPVRERLAAVACGPRRGGGYLLTPSLLLTSARLVAGPQEVRVTLPGHGEVAGLRHWQRYDEGSGADAALLALPGGPRGGIDPGERWARATALGPIPGCRAALPPGGPPGQDRPAAEEATGTYRPGAGLFSGRDLLALDGPAPPAVPPGTPVLAGDALLGMVTGGGPTGALTVMPVQLLRRDPDFHGAVGERGYAAPPTVPPAGQVDDGAAVHEARYTAYVAHRHGVLPAGYRSREAVPVRDGSGGPVPAERVPAGRDRVLLRGPAGSGRTTVLRWLALAAARQELGPGAEHLRGLVPFFLPVGEIVRRCGALPAPGDFLGAVGVPLGPPPGWVEGVLRQGRALLLVDGLDEGGREGARWLRGLLAGWPGNHWVVASRSGHSTSWLAAEHFTELTLGHHRD